MAQVTVKLGRSILSILMVDFLPTLLINMINQVFHVTRKQFHFKSRQPHTSPTWTTPPTSWWSPWTWPAWWSSPPSTCPSPPGAPALLSHLYITPVKPASNCNHQDHRDLAALQHCFPLPRHHCQHLAPGNNMIWAVWRELTKHLTLNLHCIWRSLRCCRIWSALEVRF